MANYKTDSRIVLTLDAGGTNMVFGAMRGGEFIVNPLTLPSNAHNLDLCLNTMVTGFKSVIDKLEERPAAISFAFPGPADYPNGIIGGYLPNFPSFRDGVALGPFLREKFGIPVFINGRLNRGDNSCVETFCLPHKKMPHIIAEDGVAIRAVKRVYGELSGRPDHNLEPKDIFDIAEGKREGNPEAARKAFAEMGEVAGDAMATAATLIDGLIVIGGGITAAAKYIMPALLESMRGKIHTLDGDELNRVQMKIYNLDDEEEFAAFARGEQRSLKVYGTDKEVIYDPQKRIGVAISKIGASKAISVGAYTFALNCLDK